jgi:anti-sigma regulatory factor (Ser/Thr protein kinase)
MTLDLNATPEEVMRAVDALQEFGREKQISDRDLFGLALALEECASNVVNYALERDPRRRFQVAIEHDGSVVSIELRDRGPEFDPTQVRVAEPAASDEDRPPGGWGIQLVRSYMDEIHYHREAGQNILRLTKRLSQMDNRE